MVDCTFCGSTIEVGTGVLYVKNDGKQFHFCKSKCKKNQLQLKRKAIHTKWTAKYRK